MPMSNSKCLEITEENRGIIIIDNDEPVNKPQPNQEIVEMVKQGEEDEESEAENEAMEERISIEIYICCPN